MRIFSVTDRGSVRPRNEDAHWMNGELGLFLVSDGIGSTGRGVEAAQGVVRACREALKGSPRPEELLPTLVRRANASLYEMAGERGGSFGATMAVLWIRGKEARIAWVGDSRVYRLRRGVLDRLTQDHTRAEELAQRGAVPPADAARKSALTKSVGQSPNVEFGLQGPHEVESGDLYMVASDGVTDLLSDDELASFLGQGPIKGCGIIRQSVLERGAPDNLTAILVEVEDADLQRTLDAPQIAQILQEAAAREVRPSRQMVVAKPEPAKGMVPFLKNVGAAGGKKLALEGALLLAFVLLALLTPEILSALGRRLEDVSLAWFGAAGLVLYLLVVKLRAG